MNEKGKERKLRDKNGKRGKKARKEETMEMEMKSVIL